MFELFIAKIYNGYKMHPCRLRFSVINFLSLHWWLLNIAFHETGVLSITRGNFDSLFLITYIKYVYFTFKCQRQFQIRHYLFMVWSLKYSPWRTHAVRLLQKYMRSVVWFSTLMTFFSIFRFLINIIVWFMLNTFAKTVF